MTPGAAMPNPSVLPLAAVPETPADLIPVAEAIRLMPSCRPGKRMHLSTVYRWIEAGQLRGWKRGRWTFVSRAEVLGLTREKLRRPVPRNGAEMARQSQEEREAERAAERWTNETLKRFGVL